MGIVHRVLKYIEHHLDEQSLFFFFFFKVSIHTVHLYNEIAAVLPLSKILTNQNE